MPTIAFATIKGGVGKTTLAVHVAAAFADAGQKVLFVDLDPQAHGSLVLGIEPGDRSCIADTFGPRPQRTLAEIVVPSPRRPSLFIASACQRMARLERDLFLWGHRLQALPRALTKLGWVPEVIVVDTPPTLGAFTEAALAFADVVAAPAPTGAFALQGLADVEAAWRDVRESGGDMVVVINQWDRRTIATNAAMEEAFNELTRPIAKTRIPRAEALNQAGLGYEVVFDTSPSAPVASSLRALTAELGKRAGMEKSVLRAVCNAGGKRPARSEETRAAEDRAEPRA